MKGICTDNPGIENLIVNNGVYVDKTDVLLELIRDPLVSQFLLSRPRRFGKSLMIDTLLEIFKGRRELFKDTFIGRSDRLQRRFASGDWSAATTIPRHATWTNRQLKRTDVLRRGSL